MRLHYSAIFFNHMNARAPDFPHLISLLSSCKHKLNVYFVCVCMCVCVCVCERKRERDGKREMGGREQV